MSWHFQDTPLCALIGFLTQGAESPAVRRKLAVCPPQQRFRLRDLLRYNLITVRAYFLKEAFQQLWDYNSPAWDAKFLNEWRLQTMRSRIEPMKKIARSVSTAN